LQTAHESGTIQTKFALFHKRYKLPNETDIDHNDYASWDEMQEALHKEYKHGWAVFMYDHSGLAFSINAFNCKWDSGQVGFIVSNEGTPEEAYKWATSELETYSHWINGEMFGVSVFEDTEMWIDMRWLLWIRPRNKRTQG
jgi:hypothetical protein